MLQLHKMTASALAAFFLLSGIFAPYGGSYPFFSLIKSNKINAGFSKESNKTKAYSNDICFENELEQNKILDFGTSLLLCQTMFFIINLYGIIKSNRKLIEILNLPFNMIHYIHKVDGKKDRCRILQG